MRLCKQLSNASSHQSLQDDKGGGSSSLTTPLTASQELPIYYFGYGAMVNPIARQRRGINTDEAQGALLPNYRLSFSTSGVATISPKTGWEVYGVVMKCCTRRDWNLLEAFDAGYDCVEVDVYPLKSTCSSGAEYEDVEDDEDSESAAEEDEGFSKTEKNPIRARVFVMSKSKQDERAEGAVVASDNTPQERYLKVVASGLKAYGIDEDYILDEIMSIPFIPDRKPENYLRFPPAKGCNSCRNSTNSANVKFPCLSVHAWNKECHKRLNKAARSKRPYERDLILFRLGDRAIQVDGVDASLCNPFCKWLRRNVQGPQDSTWVVVQTLFDPDLPMIASAEEITSVHQSWAENQMMERFQQSGLKATAIYRIDLENSDDDSVVAKKSGILHSVMYSMQNSFSTRSTRTGSDSRGPGSTVSTSNPGKRWKLRCKVPSILVSSANSGLSHSIHLHDESSCHSLVEEEEEGVSCHSQESSLAGCSVSALCFDEDNDSCCAFRFPEKTLATIYQINEHNKPGQDNCKSSSGNSQQQQQSYHDHNETEASAPPIIDLTFRTR